MVFTYNPLDGWRKYLKNEFIWHCNLTSRQPRGFTSPPLGLSGIPNILVPVPGKKEKLPLSVTHPELAKEACGWDPSTVTHGSDKKLEWKCKENHLWSATVSNRTGKKSGCPFCAGQRVIIGINDLASRFPEVAAEANGWNPRTEAYGTARKKSWVCAVGHNWVATVLSRTQGNGCPYCSNKVVLEGFNDLATKNPSLAMEAFGWDPSKYTPYSHKMVNWKCSKQHIWKARIANRSNGNNCPICLGKKIVTGFNDLGTTDPEIAVQADGWDPSKVSRNTHKILKWRCPIGHSWRARVDSRKFNGCPYCGGRKVLAGFNDLATTHRELAREAFDWDPTKFTAGSSVKKKWKCQEGHTWSTAINVRQKSGCPTCAVSGFDPNLDAYLYLLKQDSWQMYQIGITNDINRRISEHSRNGWQVLEVRGPMDGHLTQQWEKGILRMLKANGADLSNKNIAGKFDGYSEAWSKSKFEVKSIKELMDLTEGFEEKQ